MTAGSRRRKVQCPKCREVVTMEPAPAAPTAAAAPDEVAVLRARVEVLEGQVAWLMDHRPAAEAALLRPGQRLRWLRGVVDWTAQAEALRDNLRAVRTASLRLVAGADDLAARRRAEQLREVFLDAAWLVAEVEDRVLPPSVHGLSLRGGSCPPPRALTAASMALTAAGFEVCAGLDFALGSDEVELVVGA